MGGQAVRDQELHLLLSYAKSHVIHIGTHEHYPMSFSLKHTFAQLDLLQKSHTNMTIT